MSVMVKSPSGVSIGGSAGKGFPPGDVTIISSTVNDKTVLVKWSDPDDTIVEGTTISKWKGTLLVRKQGSYPISIKDGDIVCDNTTKNQYKDMWFRDTGLNNDITYYYRFFTYSDAKVYNDSSDLMFKCTPLSFAQVFSDNTWEQINAAAESGNIPSTWNIGDEIDIQLAAGDYYQTLTLQIWDFNHYEKSDGSGKAGLVLGCKHLMRYAERMNSISTNYEGWNSTEMKTITLPNVFNSLPIGLQAVIKEVKTKANIGSGASSTSTQESLDKLFLPSIGEVGLVYTSASEEGPTFPIFTDNASRQKKQYNGIGGLYSWWTRTPNSNSSSTFCTVNTNGDGWSGYSPTYDNGVCFCFCI